MTKYYISDTHLNHFNVIKYCNRPFYSVEEMNEAIVSNWNSTVKPNDEVFHLGDVGFYRDDDLFFKTLKRLNGQKFLVYGNHDKQIRQNKKLQSCFAWCREMAEVKDGQTSVVLSHYAMRVWNKSHHGAIHLYGHSHGTLPGDSQSCDVGVDCWNFKPVTLIECLKLMSSFQKRSPVDHHE